MKALWLGLVLVAACAEVQLPVRFALAPAQAGPAAVDNLVRALAASGITPATVDRQTGIVQTEWQDTNFMYGQVQDQTATIVRRYTITLAPAGSGLEVLVRMDTQRCAQGTFSSGPNGFHGTCVQMDGVVAQHQKDLNALGAKLKQALGAS